jgi:DNA-binding CsgD family transcriptional regulator
MARQRFQAAGGVLQRDGVDGASVTKSSQLLTAWNREFAKLLTSIDDAKRLPRAIVRAIRALVPGDVGSVVVDGVGRQPRELYRYPEHYEYPVAYPEGLFVLDPFYSAFKEGRAGSLSLLETVPAGFENTPYFQQYYAAAGIVDALLHLTVLPDGGIVAIGLMRSTERGAFTKAERELHGAAFPVVEACSVRLAKLVSEASEPLSQSTGGDVEDALLRFGADLLTAREQEVIHLVLRGHDFRSVASQLEISTDTVKMHRKHAYAKLHVSSKGELFSQFLESLRLG